MSAATFVVPPDADLIRKTDAIVVGSPIASRSEKTTSGIQTVTSFAVERVIKGGAIADVIEIREPGGEVDGTVLYIPGVPQFEPGQRMLLLLRRTSHGWVVAELVLGKFRFAFDRSGRHVLVRDRDEIAGWDPDGRPHREPNRLAAPFLDYVSSIAKGRPVAEDYLIPGEPLIGEGASDSTQSISAPATVITNAVGTATSYTMLMSGALGGRWNVFPSPVTFFASASGEPGAPGNGTVAVSTALATWTNEPGSNVNLVYGGTNSANTRGLAARDGANTVLFERDLTSWGIGPFTCSGSTYSGTLGIGGVSSASGTHTLGSETFVTILEGDVEMNRGVANCTSLFNSGDFNSAVAHEVGHALGFRHSDQDRASNGACSADPSLECSNFAIMKAVIPNGINAVLQQWDINAVRAVYPAPVCTAPSITGQPQSVSVNSGTSATLTVTATGTGPLTYQWYVGTSGTTTSPIGGATGPVLTVTPSATTTYWVRVTNSCGSVNSATTTVTVVTSAPPPPPPPTATSVRADFNGDGRSDLVWRNYATGQNYVWLMNGTTLMTGIDLPSLAPGQGWELATVGDFNYDGKPDLVWRNYTTGANVIWLMNGATLISSANLPTVSASSGWRIVGVGDFDGDRRDDILLRNTITGDNTAWLMNGTTIVGTPGVLHITPNSGWVVGGVGDFNRDGSVDILWRNTITGENGIWLMNRLNRIGIGALPSVAPNAGWEIGAIADYTGDGFLDIVWRNYTTGQNYVWIMNRTNQVGAASLTTVADPNWRIAGPK